MTNVLERVPVDRISEQARAVHVGKLLLSLIAGVFFALGWSAGKVSLALVWCAVAVKLGWQEARKAQARGAAR